MHAYINTREAARPRPVVDEPLGPGAAEAKGHLQHAEVPALHMEIQVFEGELLRVQRPSPGVVQSQLELAAVDQRRRKVSHGHAVVELSAAAGPLEVGHEQAALRHTQRGSWVTTRQAMTTQPDRDRDSDSDSPGESG